MRGSGIWERVRDFASSGEGFSISSPLLPIDLLLQVFATLNDFSLSDRADSTQFLACYSILNRYWLRITQEWPDRLSYSTWHQPTAFLTSLDSFVSDSPESYRIARVSKCVLLLDSIVRQPHMSFALSTTTIGDFARMLDRKIFVWGIGPSLVNMGYSLRGGDIMPWRDLVRSVVTPKDANEPRRRARDEKVQEQKQDLGISVVLDSRDAAALDVSDM